MKKTKNALLLSAVSMLLCLSMLVGSTFAWFTDTASTGVNKIVAGNLDVDLEMQTAPNTWETAEEKSLGFVKEDGTVITDTILWEPGCTYILQPVKVVNKGNLAFKYSITIYAANGVNTEVSGATETADLARAIDVLIASTDEDAVDGYKNIGTLRQVLDSQASDPDGLIHGVVLPAEGVGSGELPEGVDSAYAPKGEAIIPTIKLHMQETAGNEYMNQTLDSIAVNLIAAQFTYEEDSFDNTYDTTAEWPSSIKNSTELENAFNSGAESVTVTNGNYDLPVTVPEGKELVIAGGNFSSDAKNGPALKVGENSKLVVNAADISIEGYTIPVFVTGENASVELNGGIYEASGMQIIQAEKAGTDIVINGGSYAGTYGIRLAENANVTINGGNFEAAILAISDVTDYTGTVTINGGNFNLVTDWASITGGTWVKVVINGGTFSINPINNTYDNPEYVTLGAGKTVVDNGDGTWTVQ